MFLENVSNDLPVHKASIPYERNHLISILKQVKAASYNLATSSLMGDGVDAKTRLEAIQLYYGHSKC